MTKIHENKFTNFRSSFLFIELFTIIEEVSKYACLCHIRVIFVDFGGSGNQITKHAKRINEHVPYGYFLTYSKQTV